MRVQVVAYQDGELLQLGLPKSTGSCTDLCKERHNHNATEFAVRIDATFLLQNVFARRSDGQEDDYWSGWRCVDTISP